MAGPWEKYAQAAPAAAGDSEGPWTKYNGAQAPTPAPIDTTPRLEDIARAAFPAVAAGLEGAKALTEGRLPGLPVAREAASVPAAAIQALRDTGTKNIGDLPANFRRALSEDIDAREAEDADFRGAHPAVAAVGDAANGIPLPPAIKAAEGANAATKAAALLGSGAARLGTTTAIQAADAAAKGEDPKEAATRALSVGGLVEGAVLGAHGAGAIAGSPAVQGGARKLLSTLGGVSEQNISRYLERPEAIRAAQKIPLSEIKDMVDTDLARIDAGVQDAELAHSDALARREHLGGQIADAFDNVRAKITGKVQDAKEALQRSYAHVLQDLRDEAVPLDMAKRLSSSLGEQKARLGQLSDEAEDALAKTPGAVSREDLRGLLRNVAGEIGAAGANGERHLIGEEATSAVQSLHQLDQRLAALPKEIPFGTARDIMRQVRADVRNSGGYGMGAGEFNSTLNGAKKAFVGAISDHLKQASPEYAAKMAEMQPLSQSLERMNEFFGDPDSALSSLATAANGAGPRAQIVNDILQTHAQLTGSDAPLQELQRFADARRILSSPPLRQQLMESLPEFRQLQRARAALEQFNPTKTDRAGQMMLEAAPVTGELAHAESGLADAEAMRRQFPGWSPMTTESRLKNAMANTQNPDRGIEAGRSLDALSAFNGENNYRQMLGDKATGDAFDKGFSHGSRNVNLWAMIGSLFGGQAHVEPEVRAAGAGVGAAIDRFGPKMTQHGLDTFMAVRDKIGPWLGPLMEAAKRGPQSLAVTHYLLMQQNPAYQAAVTGQGQKP